MLRVDFVFCLPVRLRMSTTCWLAGKRSLDRASRRSVEPSEKKREFAYVYV